MCPDCFSLARIQQGDYKLNTNGFMLRKQKEALLQVLGEHALCLLKVCQLCQMPTVFIQSKAGGIK